ncbi:MULTISPECIES: GNAT family N-acetyltransferase [Nocardia]|uniref:GNAT family N-acetyltransferase n=1 Tax=Nocardia elegans TaxID=300029 RepID=A0ABW6TII4_9NOCA|nr:MULTISPECIES: GNAT family N-acetyltransferase [Nocardia]MBF6449363.1 GNAT family N-acetyltransferase [Nocardia elegans]
MTAEPAVDLTDVTYRRLAPGDCDAVRDLHATLDQRDGYYRFFGARPKHLEQLAAAISLNDPKHCAFGAFWGGRLIGVANYVVLPDTDCAEVAMVVAHEDQQSGIGTALLTRLAEDARRHGIARLAGDILATNSKMMQLLMDIDLPMSAHRDDEVVHVVLQLGTS